VAAATGDDVWAVNPRDANGACLAGDPTVEKRVIPTYLIILNRELG